MWRPFAHLVRSLTARRRLDEVWDVARELSPLELRSEGEGDDADFSLDSAPPRFVGYYTEAGLATAFRAYGIEQKIRRRGFRELRVAIRQDDRFTSTLRLFGLPASGDGGDDEVLVGETRCRVGVLPRPKWLSAGAAKQLRDNDRTIFIEWMLLQNPISSFTSERPRLPGQSHPGLGVGEEVMELLRILGWRLRVGAFVQNPLYAHNAILYARNYTFLEPEHQAFFLALLGAARGRSLQQITLAVDSGYLHDDETGERITWYGHDQLAPLARPLIRLYRSRAYTDAVHKTLSRTTLRFDWAAYDRVHEKLAAASPEEPGGSGR